MATNKKHALTVKDLAFLLFSLILLVIWLMPEDLWPNCYLGSGTVKRQAGPYTVLVITSNTDCTIDTTIYIRQ